jgi:hypothetical protein
MQKQHGLSCAVNDVMKIQAVDLREFVFQRKSPPVRSHHIHFNSITARSFIAKYPNAVVGFPPRKSAPIDRLK